MKRITIRIWDEDEYSYPSAWGFRPRLDGYLHEDDSSRPCIVICPGGGYRRCAPREGEPVALHFYKLGYQAFVCTYTTNPLDMHPLGKQPARDLSAAIGLIKDNANVLCVDPKRIVACGFSAGAHVVGTLGVHRDEFSAAPDAMILCYPVILAQNEIHHRPSLRRLLGTDPSKEDLEYMSLETQVKEACPPVFIWHTVTDKTVAVENSIAFADACHRAGIIHALHLFSSGDHGLALADGGRHPKEILYTLEQTQCTVDAIVRGEVAQDPEVLQKYFTLPEVKLLETDGLMISGGKKNKEVSDWTMLAHGWLSRLWDSSEI